MKIIMTVSIIVVGVIILIETLKYIKNLHRKVHSLNKALDEMQTKYNEAITDFQKKMAESRKQLESMSSLLQSQKTELNSKLSELKSEYLHGMEVMRDTYIQLQLLGEMAYVEDKSYDEKKAQYFNFLKTSNEKLEQEVKLIDEYIEKNKINERDDKIERGFKI